MKRRYAFLLTVASACLLVGAAHAAPASRTAGPDLGKCLDLTGRTGIRSKGIADNLGLTPDQVREVRSRISTYWSLRGFEGLDGIGLTPEQETEILRRLAIEAKKSSWPLGWPCKPFTHRSKVIKFVMAELVANGFRPRMKLIGSAPRQIRISAIQDGLPFIVLVVRAGGPRTILVSLKPAGTGYSGDSASYTLPYVP
jgi:hypothetical protein